MKALLLHGKINDTQKIDIKRWILDSISLEQTWGAFPKCNYGTIAHTIFALNILEYCGLSKSELRRKYKPQLKWLKKNISNIESKYDTDEVRVESGVDTLGITYYILRIYHNSISLLGELFLDLNYPLLSADIAKRIISSQNSGGWGPEKDKTTMWAIEYNVEFLLKFKDDFLKMSDLLKLLCSIRKWKIIKEVLFFLGILILIGMLVWIWLDHNRLESVLLAISTSVIVMLLQRLLRGIIS